MRTIFALSAWQLRRTEWKTIIREILFNKYMHVVGGLPIAFDEGWFNTLFGFLVGTIDVYMQKANKKRRSKSMYYRINFLFNRFYSNTISYYR